MTILVTDRAGYAVTRRELLDNGYLKVPGKVARTGIQHYLASELGLRDRSPNEIIAVYRPPEEVFAADSLASYDNADVTLEHPSDLVGAESFKAVAAGHAISPGHQDGEFVIVDLLIKDAETIKAIEAGKCELSAGYTAEYVHQPGVTDAGEAYEFVQRSIRINHVAIVDKARAGRDARLFDHTLTETSQMTALVTLDKGSTVEVADKAAAQLIQNTIDTLQQKVADAAADAKQAQDAAEAEKAKADALKDELEEEKEKASEDSISKRVAAVLAAMDGARKIAGKEFTSDSVSPVEIKRAALAAALPKRDWADKSEAYVLAAWDAEMEKKEAEDEEEEEKKKASADSLANLGQDFKGVKTGDAQKTLDTAYQAYMDRTANAWKEAK